MKVMNSFGNLLVLGRIVLERILKDRREDWIGRL